MTTIYGSAADFTTYHTARGRTIPVGWDDTAKNAALLVASEWIDFIYGQQFSGYRTGGFDQDREWPRQGAWARTVPIHIFDTDDIPDRVKNATFEAAWRQLVTPGSLMVDYTPGKYRTVRVDGAISVDYRLFNYATDIQTQIGIVDSLLWPLLTELSDANYSSLSGGGVRS